MKMKATALLFLGLLLLSNSQLQALTIEEQSTINKLKSWGIVEKQRLFEEYYKPMPAIDVMSLNIKTLSLITRTYDNQIYSMESNILGELREHKEEIIELQKQKDSYKSELKEMKKDSDRKDIGLLFLSLIAIGLNIFNK